MDANNAVYEALKFLVDTVNSDEANYGFRLEAAREILKYSSSK